MYTVYIAICLSTMQPRDCNKDNAVDWVVAPEPQSNPTACYMHGLEYISQTGLVQSGKTYPKIYCVSK